MALAAGTRLGSYEIVAPLGAGGMGEVWRARDTKLDRDVALKTLPDLFAGDPERLARFDREAKTLASLNHPHIAQIYGLEESPAVGSGHAGIRAIVMELVEGPPLADRIARGPVPPAEALAIAGQIADALEYAHDHGIVHRDLKPANIKLTADGAVKVLDFGLAKALEQASGAGLESSGLDVANSPTITSPAMTRAGVILGTAAYMSPEQAKGRIADKRCDVWAFGCVLYELLTGRRPFDGEDVTDTIVAILSREPAWDALPATTPAAVRKLLRRCLEKDRARRLGDMHDARLEIEDALAAPTSATAASGPAAIGATRRSFSTTWIGGLAGLIIGAMATGLVYQRLRAPAPMPASGVIRTFVGVGPADRLQSDPADISIGELRPSKNAIALSPDGRLVAFSAVKGDRQQLYLRPIDQLEATPIADTDGGANPFFSPDGTWIGFWADGALRKIAVAGGPATTICQAGSIFGASWGEDDAIVFAPALGRLFQVPAAGGTPQPVTTLDEKKGEVSHRLPHVLPGARAVLFTAVTHYLPDWDEAEIVAQPLPGGTRRTVARGSDARYVRTGHLLFVRSGTVVAAPFDVQRLELTGGAVTVVNDVMQAANTATSTIETGAAQFALSSSGLLAYATGGVFRDQERLLVWVDRNGKQQPLPLPARVYLGPHLSPDGQQVVLWTQGRERVVWVYNIRRGTMTRVTADGRNSRAIWMPDGRRVTFASAIAGPEDLASRAADGSGTLERLPARGQPSSWSPDGRVLAFVKAAAAGAPRSAVWLLSTGEGKAREFVNSRFSELYPEFSPDGRWIAYVSNETGHSEVYAQPYPGPGQRQQLSNNGGTQPAWATNGRELFYTEVDARTQRTRMMSVPLSLSPPLAAGVPRLLFEGQFRGQANTRGYDVTADGQRFLMVQPNERPPSPVTRLVLIQNWFEELKAKAAVQ